MSKAFEAGKPVLVPISPTIAEGLAVALVGYNAFESCKDTVTKVVGP